MNGDKRDLWVGISLAVWMLLTMGVREVAEMEPPIIGDPARWQILEHIMIWVSAIAAAAVFVYNLVKAFEKWKEE